MIKTFKYRLYPNKSQSHLLVKMLDDMRFIYNCSLEHRKSAFQKQVSISYFDQQKELKDIRNSSDDLTRWSYESCKLVLRRLNKSYNNFYSHIKAKRKTSTPRFKSKQSFNTLDFTCNNGFKILQNQIYVFGIGNIKYKNSRPVEGKQKSAHITVKNNKWYVTIQCEVEKKILEKTGESIGIDVGLTNYISGSDGLQIKTPQFFKDIEKRLRVLNRSISRKKLHSKNQKKAREASSKLYSKMTNRRRDFLHKLTTNLIMSYDTVVLEDLSIKGLSKGILSKSFHNASLGLFTNMLLYKAESAGREIEFVDPRYTSQTCPDCGTIKKKDLSERWHSCECGCEGDRDVIAGRVILMRSRNKKELRPNSCGVKWNDGSSLLQELNIRSKV